MRALNAGDKRVITSRENSLIKRARAARDGKLPDQIFLEGLRLCEEAVSSLSVESILEVLCAEGFESNDRAAKLLEALTRIGKSATVVADKIFSSICDTKSPQGIVILASRPDSTQSAFVSRLDTSPLLVILCDINNPSNAGAIVRVAEAAAASGIILTRGSTDIYSPKALRGAMGSSFRLPILTGATLDDALAFCRDHGIHTFSADLQSARSHTEIDWTRPAAVIIGSEARGLAGAEIARADESIRIPMSAPVESLNVAIATGIILYEAARQRRRA